MKFAHCMILSALLLLVIGLALFPGAGRDDKYISFWTAYTLSQFGEILNYNGMRVEQSSSLLFVCLLAGLRAITGASLVPLGYGVAIACGVGAVIAAGLVGRRLGDRTGQLAMLLTASAAYFVYWTFGSMEAPLVGLLSLWMVGVMQGLSRSGVRPGIWIQAAFAFLCFALVRPESPFVLVCVLGFSVALALLDHARLRSAGSRAFLRNMASAFTLGLVVIAMVLAFRLGYFDSAFPQPVAAKSHVAGFGTMVESISAGIRYLLWSRYAFLLAGLSFLGLGAFGAGLRHEVDRLRAPLVGFALAYGAFIVFSGGGWMEGARFVAHMTPAVAILAADGLLRFVGGRRQRLAAGLVLAAQLGLVVLFSHYWSMSLPLWEAVGVPQIGARNFHWIERINREHRRDSAVIEVLDGVASKLPMRPLAERPHVLTHNVGMIMFYLQRDYPGRLGSIDLHGVSDRYVTDSPYRATLPSWALGLRWNHIRFLRDYDQIAKYTGVPYPSVLFWNNNEPPGSDPWPRQFGFTTYMAQRGRVSPAANRWFHGRRFDANQFLSVNEAIRSEAGLGEGFLYLDMERILAESVDPLDSVIERLPAGSRR